MSNTLGSIRNNFLKVNLTEGSFSTFTLPKEYFEWYLGGKALGTRLILDHKIYQVDSLSEYNKIFLLCGPISGTNIPGAGKIVCLTKSPLTGMYMDTTSGGRLAHNIKAAGYDGILIEGMSKEPVYLYIRNNKVEIHPCQQLWGSDCYQTEKKLRKLYGNEISVAGIGPAGENGVFYANMTVDFYHQAGRGGLGAVLGSKQLKAIVVYGDKSIHPAYPERLNKYVSKIIEAGKADQKVQYRIRYGTLSTIDLTNRLGMVPVKNFTEGVAENIDMIKSEAMRQKYVVKNLSCFGCPTPCGKATKFQYKGQDYIIGGPEYESLALLGVNLGVTDPDFLYLIWLCDVLGLDTMSTGVTLSCVLEGLEKGFINSSDIGISISWGETEKIASLITDIAYNRGAGKMLARGVRSLAEGLPSLNEIAMHINGLEMPAYDPRGSFGYALAMSVADRGACHRRARPLYQEVLEPETLHSYNGKAELIFQLENERAFYHSLVMCDFIPTSWSLKFNQISELVYLSTGLAFSKPEADYLAQRAFAQARIFNLFCGRSASNDTLPKRFFREAMHKGPSASFVLNEERFRKMVSDYYRLRVWDEQGKPTETLLASLDINEEGWI